MVDNRGVSPIPSFNFKSGDASGMANKMSEEKMGQGGEYFAQDMQEEDEEQQQNQYQDRSAQLRASLDSLAMVNAGMIAVNKLKEKEKLNKVKETTDYQEESGEQEEAELTSKKGTD